MILVAGATGTVGSNLVRELAALGAPTRALIRKTHDPEALEELGIEPAIGSFEDARSLAAALAGVERLFILSPAGVEGMVAQQLQVLEAARASGEVRHVVKLSSIAADESEAPSIVAAHRRIEEAVEQSQIGWTHLRPNWFMQNELGQANQIATEGIFYAPDVTQVSMIDARDVAAVAASVLTGEGHEGQAYTLTGPQSVGYADLASIYSQLLDREVSWQQVSLSQARESMLGSGLPPELAEGFCEIMGRYRDGGVTRESSPEVERLLDRPPRTFEQFARDHIDKFPETESASGVEN
jgi:uncharacterized protein YbjT (DUF2867 family)